MFFDRNEYYLFVILEFDPGRLLKTDMLYIYICLFIDYLSLPQGQEHIYFI